MRLIIAVLALLGMVMAEEVKVQILGSGGPELDGRASSSYLVWIDDKARILIDTGSGSMYQYEQSGAQLEDLQAVVLTHLHIDHAVDLPSYIKAGYFTDRKASLPIIAPFGNEHFPSIENYVSNLFGPDGAYRYMQDVLGEQSDSFRIIPKSINQRGITQYRFEQFELLLTPVNHGNVPALAVRIDAGEKRVMISGDTSNKRHGLEQLAKDVDLFIAHHAITEQSGEFAKNLHMTPDQIGEIAKKSDTKQLVLSHRMKRTLTHEADTLMQIKRHYSGKIILADDMMIINP